MGILIKYCHKFRTKVALFLKPVKKRRFFLPVVPFYPIYRDNAVTILSLLLESSVLFYFTTLIFYAVYGECNAKFRFACRFGCFYRVAGSIRSCRLMTFCSPARWFPSAR